MKENYVKDTLRLAIPMMLTQLLGYAAPVVDTVMAGRESPQVLASVALGAQLLGFVLLFGIGIAVAITTSVARYHGAHHSVGVRRSFQQGLWLSALLAVLVTVGILVIAYVPYVIGTDKVVADGVRDYLWILSLGVGAMTFAQGARFFLEGVQYPNTAVWVQLALIPCNIVGNYIFLKGFWWIPPMGVRGMAIATTLCFWLYAYLMLRAVVKNPRWASYRLFQSFAPIDFKHIKEFVRVGLPIAIANMLEVGLFTAVGLLVSRGGAVQTSANQIALNYASLTFMLPLGLAYVLTSRIGYFKGAKNQSALRYVALSGMALGGGLMLVFVVLVSLYGEVIARWYSLDAEVVALTVEILAVVAWFQLFDGIQVCAAGVLRGLQETRSAMMFALIGYWALGFPLGLLLAYGFDYGAVGLWAGIAVGLAVNACLAVWKVWHVIGEKTTE
ncbi:MAG: MATE family efflux transporter [Cardiobacteriaceae bacterium]|nr:MATE family efflux transporter [Cardiobacteriaceae bacterium]